MEKDNKLPIHKLFLKYFLPQLLSFFVISFYVVIDAAFVKKYVGVDALAGVNLAFPIMQFIIGISLMVGIGTSTVIGIELGKGDIKEASRVYSMMIFVSAILSVLFMPLLNLISQVMYANSNVGPEVIEQARVYSNILILTTPIWVVSQYFLSVARAIGKPMAASIVIITGNILNIIFDYILLDKFNMGVEGAVIATGSSAAFVLIIGIFIVGNKRIKFTKFKLEAKRVWGILYNGFSDLVAECSYGLTQLIFLYSVSIYAGKDGVVALGLINYLSNFLVLTIYGMAVSVQPIISYNHGANNAQKINEVKNFVLKWSTVIGTIFFVIMNVFIYDFVKLFGIVKVNIIELAINAARLYAPLLILVGYNSVYISYYTAIEDARTSAIFSILKGLIFVIIGIIILPGFLGLDGVWLTFLFSEVVTAVCIYFVNLTKKARLIVKNS